MSKVYAVQLPHKLNKRTGVWEPMFDPRPAATYGALVELVPYNHRAAMLPQPTLRALRRGLKDYGDGDYLLPTGDPILVGMAMHAAADVNRGRVRVLRWDREAKGYTVVEVAFYGPTEP